MNCIHIYNAISFKALSSGHQWIMKHLSSSGYTGSWIIWSGDGDRSDKGKKVCCTFCFSCATKWPLMKLVCWFYILGEP